MATPKKSKTKKLISNDEQIKASSYQVNNLLRFLNKVQKADDIITHLGLPNNKKIKHVLNNVIYNRDESGPYFYIHDLYSVKNLDIDTIQLMLNNSLFPIVSESRLNNSTPFVINNILETFLSIYSSNLLFKIDFPRLPKKWEVGELLTLVEEKIVMLRKNYSDAEIIYNDKERELKNKRKAFKDGSATTTQSDVDKAESAVTDAETNLDAAYNEIEEFINAYNDKKPDKLWKITKKNIQLKIKELDAIITEKVRRHRNATNKTLKEKLKIEIEKKKSLKKYFEDNIKTTDTAIKNFK